MIHFERSTASQKFIVLLGLFYFLSPIRLLINLIPVIGDVADAFVIVFLIAIYRRWHPALVQSTDQSA